MFVLMRLVAFAGLWYLSLFLWSRFCVAIPPASSPNVDADEHHEPLLSNLSEPRPVQTSKKSKTLPVYMLLLPYIPLGLAIFIAGTRYFDFRNHGFDVSAGAAVGWVTAYFGFRIYHPSLYGAERDA
jgi:membrane-associated phospholipid phosphatase